MDSHGHWTRWTKLVGLFAGVVILDRLTKRIVMSSMNYRESISIVGDFFRLTYVRNLGGAFGTRLGGNIFYITAAIIALLILILWLLKQQHLSIGLTGIALMLGGAIGNLWDRFIMGKVVDFIDFGIGNIRWPTFNIADSAITVGIILLIVQEIFLANKTVPERHDD